MVAGLLAFTLWKLPWAGEKTLKINGRSQASLQPSPVLGLGHRASAFGCHLNCEGGGAKGSRQHISRIFWERVGAQAGKAGMPGMQRAGSRFPSFSGRQYAKLVEHKF